MQSNPTERSPTQSLSYFTARVGRWSVRHRKTAIFGWLAFVLVALFIRENVLPQKEIDANSGMPGESGQAAKAPWTAPSRRSSPEQVLVQRQELSAGESWIQGGRQRRNRPSAGYEGRGQRRGSLRSPAPGRSRPTGIRRS